MEGRGGQLGSVVRRLCRRQIVGERRSGQPGGALSLSLSILFSGKLTAVWRVGERNPRG